MRSLDQREPVSSSSTPARPVSRATLGRASACVAASAFAFALAGCSVSYPLFGDEKDELKTGSIARAPQSDVATYKPDPADRVTTAPLPPPPGAALPQTPSAPVAPSAYAAPSVAPAPAAPPSGLTPEDWTYARGALGLAMGAEAANASVPWANPDSGAYGSFTAAAAPTLDNGATCRPFAASHSARGQVQRLEGTACRTAAGYWEAVAIRTAASRTL